ncbi:MAG: nucleotidyltransferase domain-containing protein [Pseudomonadota bacterium]
MAQNESIQEKIDEMVRRIVHQFNPEKIILFGSHARGMAGPDSDVDLLIIMPVSGSKREKQVEIGVALHDIPMPMDILIATPEEVERRKNIIGTIIRPALREGEVLYVRGGRNINRHPRLGNKGRERLEKRSLHPGDGG